MNNHIVDEWVEAYRLDERYYFFQKYPLNDRVLRLFVVACCREIWNQLTDERSRYAVETAELYADRLSTEEELRKARDDARDANAASAVSVYWSTAAAWSATSASAHYAASASAYAAASASAYAAASAPAATVYKQQGLILAQMYPTTFNHNYITQTTTSLAKQIYDNKDFSLMPILADALQDVDCNEEILNHLRGKGPFYKGNYIIDVLIGKR